MKKKEKYKDINAKQLKKKIDSKANFVLVDVLGEENYNKQHLPKAINIPVAEADFKSKVKKELPNKKTPVIVYCSNEMCLASPGAAKILIEMGYKDVTHFKGGLKGWQESGYSFTSKGKQSTKTCSEGCTCCK